MSCGEYGDNVSKLVTAIDNGKNDIREGKTFPNLDNIPPKVLNGLANVTGDNVKENHGQPHSYHKAIYYRIMHFNINIGFSLSILVSTDAVAIPVDLSAEKSDNVNSTLLYPNTTKLDSNKRYPTSEFHQFWVVLKRTLLFSRRDWVSVGLLHFGLRNASME